MSVEEMITTADTTGTLEGERADILEMLVRHRQFLRMTVRGITDEQARHRPTVSELSLGGLIKHVTSVEKAWADFILTGPSALGDFETMTEADWEKRAADFHMLPDETLAGLLEAYDRVAARTDGLVATLPDLDASHPLPKAPWFEGDRSWSARRTLLHIVAETSQHAGHADIIRETLDGAKTMG
ncbi:DinB family protein [Streptomyces sp. CO7]